MPNVAPRSRHLPHRKGKRTASRIPEVDTPDSGAVTTPIASDDLKSLPLIEVEKRLGFSPDGLSQAEAQRRLVEYGPNEIAEQTTNQLVALLAYFWGPIPWMIEVAVILSGLLGHWANFCIILVLLVANAGIGFWEEHQAGKAIAALKAQLAIKARVKRDGTWSTPPSRELVPGDVIRMRLGDIVPADARLLDGDPVEVDQSALTGESLPAEKKSGMRCSPGRSSDKARSARWSMAPARTPTSARRRNSCRRRTPSATSNVRC